MVSLLAGKPNAETFPFSAIKVDLKPIVRFPPLSLLSPCAHSVALAHRSPETLSRHSRLNRTPSRKACSTARRPVFQA